MKNRTPRRSEISHSWAKRVYFLANINAPTKDQRKSLHKLWLEGYSNKDAAQALVEG